MDTHVFFWFFHENKSTLERMLYPYIAFNWDHSCSWKKNMTVFINLISFLKLRKKLIKVSYHLFKQTKLIFLILFSLQVPMTQGHNPSALYICLMYTQLINRKRKLSQLGVHNHKKISQNGFITHFNDLAMWGNATILDIKTMKDTNY